MTNTAYSLPTDMVANAVEAEVTDIGLGRDEGHRHAVAHLGIAPHPA